jgi:hypothetical protein
LILTQDLNYSDSIRLELLEQAEKELGIEEENVAFWLDAFVGFQISTKNTNLVEDHPMNISGKFGSILFSGFREDLNVKS